MSVEVAIAAALNTLVGSRVYPNIAQQGATTPYIVYTDVSSIPDSSICGTTEDTERLYQIDIYHLNHSDLRALRRQVFAALEAMDQIELIDSWSGEYEPDTRLHRCLMRVRFYEHEIDL
jgi:hypothetical protein